MSNGVVLSFFLIYVVPFKLYNWSFSNNISREISFCSLSLSWPETGSRLTCKAGPQLNVEKEHIENAKRNVLWCQNGMGVRKKCDVILCNCIHCSCL